MGADDRRLTTPAVEDFILSRISATQKASSLLLHEHWARIQTTILQTRKTIQTKEPGQLALTPEQKPEPKPEVGLTNP